MLLMKLESQEKFAFLHLSHYLARIDNIYGEKEEEIIIDYCTEMGIDNLDVFDIDNFSLEKILSNFKSKKSKKIVVLELMILIHIDSTFHKKEKELVEKIIKKFEITKDEIEKYSKWGETVAILSEEAKSYIK